MWRLLLLVGAPLAFAITGLFHLVPASESTAGSDFDHLIPHSGLWIAIHVAQLVFICLLALAVAALTDGIGAPVAKVSRVALVPFVAFYSAFDASVGLSGGLLARYVSQHPSLSADIGQAFHAVTDPLSAPVLIAVYAIAVLCWLVATIGAAIAVRQAGVDLIGPILLVGGAAVFAIDHAAPFGPIGMVLFLIGAVVTDRQRFSRRPDEAQASAGERAPSAGLDGIVSG
jgi:lysylphosphatidylglycerol synthetase-like protein (DUF2156 family)